MRRVGAGHGRVALVLGALEPAAGVETERPQRALAMAARGDGAVGLVDLGARLLVVDVLELDEGAVPGREEARLDGLAAAADPQVEVGRGQLPLVAPEGARRLDLDGL